MHQPPHQWIGIAISLTIVALITGLRMRQVGRERPLRLETLWLIPAIAFGVAAWLFAQAPPHGIDILYCALALVLGAVLGWHRGKTMRISVDPRTHALNQTTSPAAILFLLAMVVVRTGSRLALIELGVGRHALLLATDLLIALAIGFISFQRLEMFLRARRLLDAARRAGKPE